MAHIYGVDPIRYVIRMGVDAWVIFPFTEGIAEILNDNWMHKYQSLNFYNVLSRTNGIDVSLVMDPGPKWAVEWMHGRDITLLLIKMEIYKSPENACRTMEEKIAGLENELNAADEESIRLLDLLQMERKKSYNHANTIIKMIDCSKKKDLRIIDDKQIIKVIRRQYRELNADHQNLKTQVSVKTKNNNTLHKANRQLVARLGQANATGKPDYEVQARRDIYISSFKMSTISTAIRWICAAAVVSSFAHILIRSH